MDTIKLRSHVGSDGILKLEVPVGLKDADLDVIVHVTPIGNGGPAKTPEELGWPEGFFEKTAGSMPDFPLRDEQGEYGRLRAWLALRGTPIGPNDLMIAAIAVANNLTLVTHNTREFSRIHGLAAEDWEIPAT